jgi:pimeloyl-ACP methyl ester carboxylesterase
MFAEGTPAEAAEAFARSLREFHPDGFRTMARACAEDLRPALSSIRLPTLVVAGEQDVRAPIEAAERLHDAIAGSTLVVLPGAGHVCNIDAPEAFNRTVRDFLRDAARRSGRSTSGDSS